MMLKKDYNSIRKYLMPDLLKAFDGPEGDKYREAIKREHIYRVIHATVRQMTKSDLPPGLNIDS